MLALHRNAFEPPAAAAPARYGEARRISLPATMGVVLMHAAALGGLLYLRPAIAEHTETRVQVVDVKLSPPPQPPAAKKPSPPRSEVAKLEQTALAPPPPVQLAVSTSLPPPEAAPQFRQASAPPAPPAPPAPAVPASVQGGDLGTQMVSGRPPRYPIDCRRRREQGTVVLALTLGVDGAVQSIAVARSSGFPRLDEAALGAVRSWRWAPVLRAGQPVIVRGVVEIPFVLRDDDGRGHHRHGPDRARDGDERHDPGDAGALT